MSVELFYSSCITVLYLCTVLTHAGVGAAVEGLDVLDLDAALGADTDPGVARSPLARVKQQSPVSPGDLGSEIEDVKYSPVTILNFGIILILLSLSRGCGQGN